MFKRVAAVALASMLISLAGCSAALHVEHQAAAKHDFSKYKSFAVLHHPVGADARVTPALERRAAEAMTKRGFTQVAAARADLLLSFKVLLRHDLEVAGDASAGTDVQEELAGKTLVLMLQERVSHRVVWLGWSQAELSSAAKLASTARVAAEQLVSRLPKRTSQRVATR